MTKLQGIEKLRRLAVSQSLFPPTSLKAAMERLGFVQADPIRAPARAQDLILRHRVDDYRTGDLERHYEQLDIEEDYLYAYGFVSREVWRLLHRPNTDGLTGFEEEVLAAVQRLGPTHPKELEVHFGRGRATNAWGSFSKATTLALEALHRRGLLRVARRDRGVRVYEAMPPAVASLESEEALRRLTMVTARLLGPAQRRILLGEAVSRIRRILGGSGRYAVVDGLLRDGELHSETFDGVPYVWPAGIDTLQEQSPRVRFLCPFDPLVWDRRRFEHLWGWAYRFEAYTPPAKRLRGYYAMPLLWGDEVIGWANFKVVGGKLDVNVGYVDSAPADRSFKTALDDEIGRFETFMDLAKTPAK